MRLLESIRFIPTRVHAVLDYMFGVFLLGSPWFFKFDHGSVETWLPIALGSSLLLYSLFTDYEFAVARHIPMPFHLLIDALGAVLLAASPWLFGFSPFVALPHLLMGTGEFVVALFTSWQPVTHKSTALVKADAQPTSLVRRDDEATR